MDEKSFEVLERLIRYLANSLLGISIFVFVMNLVGNGLEVYSDQLLWTQLNSMWLVVILLILVEKYYLPQFVKRRKK